MSKRDEGMEMTVSNLEDSVLIELDSYNQGLSETFSGAFSGKVQKLRSGRPYVVACVII